VSANRFKIGDLVQFGNSNKCIGIVEGIGDCTTNIESWCAVRWLNSDHLSVDRLNRYHINNIEPYKSVPRAN
jgi:hypothetical protein